MISEVFLLLVLVFIASFLFYDFQMIEIWIYFYIPVS